MRAGGSKTTTALHLGLIRKAAGSESEQYVAHTPLWLHREDYGILDSTKGTDANWRENHACRIDLIIYTTSKILCIPIKIACIEQKNKNLPASVAVSSHRNRCWGYVCNNTAAHFSGLFSCQLYVQEGLHLDVKIRQKQLV